MFWTLANKRGSYDSYVWFDQHFSVRNATLIHVDRWKAILDDNLSNSDMPTKLPDFDVSDDRM